jgi:hypothetical protein
VKTARTSSGILLLVPFVLLLAHAHVAYWRDIESYRRWSVGAATRTPGPEDPSSPLRSLYRRTDCNYPALGGLVTAGSMRLLAHMPGGAPQALRGVLALVDAIVLSLVLAILVRFGVAGAWWWLVASAACLAAAVHVKQLAVFSLPALLVLQAYATVVVRRRGGGGAVVWLVPLLVGAALLVGVDRWLFDLPEGSPSILANVWARASRHAGMLTINGPNVWSLLGRPGPSPSAEPVIGPLTPAGIGQTVFVVQVVLVLAALSARLVRLRDGDRRARASAVAWCFWAAGLSNLLMGVWLTGVHERYLAHAFPLLFLGILGLRATSPPALASRWLASIAVAAAACGLLVLRVLYVGSAVTGLASQQGATALLLLVVGSVLTVATVHSLVTSSTVPC